MDPAGQTVVQAGWDGNVKTMRAGVGWELSVQPEFGPGRALEVLPAVLPEGEPFVFLSVMRWAKCEEVGQPRVHVVPPFDTLYPQMTHYTHI